jgi:hypothetical protein
MKTSSALARALILVACAALAVSCSDKGKAMDIRKAAKDKDLSLALNGTVSLNSLELKAKNSSKAEHRFKLPAGAVLDSKDKKLQPLVILADTEVVLGPEEEKTVPVPVFGLGFRLPIASVDDSYSLASYGSVKDSGVKKILAYLSSASGKADYPAGDADKVNTAQQAVWLVTDKLGYEENVGYIIDSLIFSTIMQQNPTAIIGLLDDSSAIADEDSMQKAVYALVMDRPKLHDKLKATFTDQYDAASKQLRENIDKDVGPKYRQSVNDFIAKAGLGISY